MYSIWKARDRSNPLSANSEGGSQSSSSLELTFIYRKSCNRTVPLATVCRGDLCGLKQMQKPLFTPAWPPYTSHLCVINGAVQACASAATELYSICASMFTYSQWWSVSGFLEASLSLFYRLVSVPPQSLHTCLFTDNANPLHTETFKMGPYAHTHGTQHITAFKFRLCTI